LSKRKGMADVQLPSYLRHLAFILLGEPALIPIMVGLVHYEF
jgi:hypothetical protein